MNTLKVQLSKPWYREFWPWFLMSLPATAVIAGLTTAWLAFSTADGLVVGDYYKAGLVINQTLARDDVALAKGINATLKVEDGALSITLTGRMHAYPEKLTLTLAHPTHQGMDHIIELHHAGGGQYRAVLPAIPNGKWHAQLVDDQSTWRLADVLHTPFVKPVTLTAASETIVQQPMGD